jgi:hypothetical protein
LTKDNTAKTALCAALLLCASIAVWSDKLSTAEIPSNNIYGFAGSGDTLWMLTDKGLYYTLAASDTLTWLGYKATLPALAMGFGRGTAVVCLDTLGNQKPGRLLICRNADSSFEYLELPFKPDSIPEAKRAKIVFRAAGVIYAAGAFWLACTDGGLVRWDPSGTAMRTFFPKVQRSFDPAAVRLDSTNEFTTVPDFTKQVIAVGVADSTEHLLYVMTPKMLYRFSPSDTSWDTLPSRLNTTSGTFDKFIELFASPRSPLLFASIAEKTGSGAYDTLLYRYGNDSLWIPFTSSQYVSALTFGPDSMVYLVRKSSRDAQPNILTAYSGNTMVRSDKSFTDRIQSAMNYQTPDIINNILYIPKSDTSGSFWIGTASLGVTYNGLFYSRNELRAEENNTPFVYVHFERKIESGLKETYALPGILSGQMEAVFVYSLSREAKVTISVYDWNMELVKNVITKENRLAGKDVRGGHRGRSTDWDIDKWDGKNNAGKRVAVGVYYFRITATTGERSFGKIIVAK